MNDDGWWRRQARRYDRVTLALHPGMPRLAAAVADHVRGSARVLELGAGTGLVTQALAESVGALVATDRSEAMLAVLRARLGDRAKIEVRVADALRVDAPDASYDAVVAANLLHLLPDPAAALAEWTRLVKPGGALVVPTFAHRATVRARVISRLMRWLGGFAVTTRFTGPDLDALVSGAGLAIIHAETLPGRLPIRLVVGRRGPDGKGAQVAGDQSIR